MKSSVRLTTATLVALRFRNVVVSRKGFSTILSSAHSTPIGAKLIEPFGSTVVTMVSTITGRDRPAGELWRAYSLVPGTGAVRHQPLREGSAMWPAPRAESDRASGIHARSGPTRDGTVRRRPGSGRAARP